MSVAVDATSNSNLTDNLSSKSWSHTISGSNRYLIVAVHFNQSNTGSETVSSVTYNSVAMSSLGAAAIGGSGTTDRCVQLWGLVAPSTGTNTVAVTMSGNCSFHAGAISFTGVDQTTPTGTLQSDSHGATTASTTTTTSSAPSDIVFSAMTCRTTSTLTVPGTTQWNSLLGTNNRYGAATQSGSASVTSTYTWTTADNAAQQAVNVRSASATITLTQTATARIANTRTKTQTATSRISNTRTKTQTATARIEPNVTFTKTQTATARIANDRSKTQSAVSRISNTLTKTQSATARVSNTRRLTQTATARIVQTTYLFSPPLVDGPGRGSDRFWGHFRPQKVGVTVLKSGSTYTQKQSPDQFEVAAADIAYIGGHEYVVSADEADALVAAGYEVSEGVTTV